MSLKTDADYVYRDKITPGSSVNNNPQKAGIRGLFEKIPEKDLLNTNISLAGGESYVRSVIEKLGEILSVEDAAGANDDEIFRNAYTVHGAIGYGPLKSSRVMHLYEDHVIPASINHWQGPQGSPGENYGLANYFDFLGTVVLHEGATLSFERPERVKVSGITFIAGSQRDATGTGYDDMVLPFPSEDAAAESISRWTGTAFLIDGTGTPAGRAADVTFEDCMFFCFETAIDAREVDRIRHIRVKGDCHNGLPIHNCADVSHREGCHFWCWTIVHQLSVGGNERLVCRLGSAYADTGTGDWTKNTNCFSLGYKDGRYIDGPSHVTDIGCSFDHFAQIVGTTGTGIYSYLGNIQPKGYRIQGSTTRSISLAFCQTAAQYDAIEVNLTGTLGPAANPAPSVEIIGHRAWGTVNRHLWHRAGICNVIGGTWEDVSPYTGNVFKFEDAILAARVDISYPSNPDIQGSTVALNKVAITVSGTDRNVSTTAQTDHRTTNGPGVDSWTGVGPGAYWERNARIANGTRFAPTDVIPTNTISVDRSQGWINGAFRNGPEVRVTVRSVSSNNLMAAYEIWQANSGVAYRHTTFCDNNTLLPPLGTADPSTGLLKGQFYYNVTDDKMRVYNGTIWGDM